MVSEMKHNFLYLVWKDPLTRRNYTVGKLSKNEGYSFEYYGEYKLAIKAGWDYIKSFPSVKIYRSDTLFTAFSSRLPDKKRRDIAKVLEKYGLSEYDGFELLRRSGGRLPIDSYEFIEPLKYDEENINKDFYIVGVRHVADCVGENCANLNKVSIGMELALLPQPENKHDDNAVLVCIPPANPLGYIPRYYSEDVSAVIRRGGKYTCTIIEKNNSGDCHDCIKVRLVM